MTCSPKQASFIGANGYVEGPGFEDYEGQMVEMVESVTYYANTAFVEAVYDSCKDVVHPAIGPVMTFLCGRWGAEHCDGFRMFDFQGSVTNGYAPFNINYIYSSLASTPDGSHIFHNPKVLPCDAAAPNQVGKLMTVTSVIDTWTSLIESIEKVQIHVLHIQPIEISSTYRQ